MKQIRTDADVMKIANRIDVLQDELTDLIRMIEDSEHPNAKAITDDLYDQCHFIAWANHVVHGYLVKPDQWDCNVFEDGGHGHYFHKAGKQAARTNFKNKMEKRRIAFERANQS